MVVHGVSVSPASVLRWRPLMGGTLTSSVHVLSSCLVRRDRACSFGGCCGPFLGWGELERVVVGGWAVGALLGPERTGCAGVVRFLGGLFLGGRSPVLYRSALCPGWRGCGWLVRFVV